MSNNNMNKYVEIITTKLRTNTLYKNVQCNIKYVINMNNNIK